jgi:uncharacterized protein YndB with AHSA1/START domain
MNTQTKMEIRKPAKEIFEAFVDPLKIGNFWFSSSSERWGKGKSIKLRYDEYDAEGEIHILEMIEYNKIVYEWGKEEGEPRFVTIAFHESSPDKTVVEVTEEGFDRNDPDLIPKLLDNKGGWVYTLTCLKGYLEFGANRLRAALQR